VWLITQTEGNLADWNSTKWVDYLAGVTGISVDRIVVRRVAAGSVISNTELLASSQQEADSVTTKLQDECDKANATIGNCISVGPAPMPLSQPPLPPPFSPPTPPSSPPPPLPPPPVAPAPLPAPSPLQPGEALSYTVTLVTVVQGELDSFDQANWRQLVATIVDTPVEYVVVRSVTAASVRPTTEVQTFTEAEQKAVKAKLEAACKDSTSGLGECEGITAEPPKVLAAPSPPPSPPDVEEEGSSANLLWLLMLLLLLPLAWVAFVQYRHKGKVGIYWKWRTTHSFPTFNPRYMPRERREELEKVLFGEGSGGSGSSGVVSGQEPTPLDKDKQEMEAVEGIDGAQASSSDSADEEKKDLSVNSAPASDDKDSGDSGRKSLPGGDDAKKRLLLGSAVAPAAAYVTQYRI